MKQLLDLCIWYFHKGPRKHIKNKSGSVAKYNGFHFITLLGELLFKTGKKDFVSYQLLDNISAVH